MTEQTFDDWWFAAPEGESSYEDVYGASYREVARLAWLAAPSHPVGSALLEGIVELAREAHAHWDADREAKVGKILLALAGYNERYDRRSDALHAALAAPVAPEPAERTCGNCSQCTRHRGGNVCQLHSHLTGLDCHCDDWTPPASQPAEAVIPKALADEMDRYWKGHSSRHQLTDAIILALAGTQAAAEPDTETMVAEVAAALEVVRARHIVEEVQSLDIGGKDADMPTQFQAGYQLACEEILTRIGGAHASDCALHNGPAYPPAPCDCIAPSEATAVAPADQCQACGGQGGTQSGGVCAECYGQGTYSGAREFVEGMAAAVEPAAQSDSTDELVPTRGTDAIVAAWNDLPSELRLSPHLCKLFEAVKTCRDVDTSKAVEPAKVETEDEINLRAWARGYAQERGAKQFMSAGKTYNTATGLLVATMAAEPVAPEGAVEPAAQAEGSTVQMIDVPDFGSPPFGVTAAMSQEELWRYACLVGYRTALAAQPPAAQAEPSVKICEDVRDRLWYDAKREQAAGADDCMVALRRYYASPAPEGAVETAKASEAKDAARYRWLRDEDVEVPDGQRDISVWLDRLPHSDQFDKQLFGEEMDAAIDAALATPSTEGAK